MEHFIFSAVQSNSKIYNWAAMVSDFHHKIIMTKEFTLVILSWFLL